MAKMERLPTCEGTNGQQLDGQRLRPQQPDRLQAGHGCARRHHRRRALQLLRRAGREQAADLLREVAVAEAARAEATVAAQLLSIEAAAAAESPAASTDPASAHAAARLRTGGAVTCARRLPRLPSLAPLPVLPLPRSALRPPVANARLQQAQATVTNRIKTLAVSHHRFS